MRGAEDLIKKFMMKLNRVSLSTVIISLFYDAITVEIFHRRRRPAQNTANWKSHNSELRFAFPSTAGLIYPENSSLFTTARSHYTFLGTSFVNSGTPIGSNPPSHSLAREVLFSIWRFHRIFVMTTLTRIDPQLSMKHGGESQIHHTIPFRLSNEAP